MKLLMLFRDREYMKALSDCLVRTDNNMIVEIAKKDSLNSDLSEYCLLTDLDESEIKRLLPENNRHNIVCLTENESETESDDVAVRSVFKYQNINSLIAELKCVTYEVTSRSMQLSVYKECNYISVCCDGNNLRAYDISSRFVRQLIYRAGEEAVLIPLLSYIADSASDLRYRNIRKLVYMLENDRHIPKELFIHEDSTGVQRVSLPPGLNPLCNLSDEILFKMMEVIKSYGYRHIVFLIGDCFNDVNLKLLRESGYALWINEASGSEEGYEKLKAFRDGKDLIQMDIKNMKTPLDVWIDNYIMREFGGR